jgi:hypothetical protein
VYDFGAVPRLGDILVKLGLCTPEQVQSALAAQVLYGARLGTNLIELGHINLDNLARGLARRAKLPAALAGHFERRDLTIQARVPAELAAKLKAVPLGKLAHDSDRVAVAVRDRLSEHARGELAFHLDIEPDQIVEAVAPELRLYYHLELAYQIPRANRFLRVDRDRSGVIAVPQAPPTAEESDVELPAWTGDAAAPTPPPVTPASDVEPAALDYQTAPAVDDAVGRARRRFVPQLGQAPSTTQLARIAVRQVITEVGMRPIGEVGDAPPRTKDELLRAVRRAPSRDRVAELVLTSLADLPGVPLDAVALLVVRQRVAMGWKGVCSEGAGAIESLALSLSGEGVVARCYQEQRPLTINLAPATIAEVDRQMWSVMGGRTPTAATAAPISIGDQIGCMLYGHGHVDLTEAATMVVAMAEAAGIAFSRLLRAAQR